MPSIYQPRRPRASPLWQLVQHGWDEFIANYEKRHRKDLGPLHPAAVITVDSLFKLFYLSLKNISHKWTQTVPNWPSALSHFAIEFEDRMPNNH